MREDKLLIANAQGFWGDTSLAPLQLIEDGPLDYLTFDYLAEITMSILNKQKMRNPELGYAADFVTLVGEIIERCQKNNIKIIANAGGVNPIGCRDAIVSVIQSAGISGVKVAVVEGDDILDQVDQLMEAGEAFSNLDTGEEVVTVKSRLTSANVYIGAAPIVEALEQGADIVITGRASDPSLVLAPLIYEFGWSMDDYDKMAAGTIMGHIIECGTQCTGGNYSNWRDVPDLARIGFPVIEASSDGSFVVTKQNGTGGLVNKGTVASQLLYELGDPVNFLGPDCVTDFTSIEIAEDGDNRVRVTGAKGRAPTTSYKVSMAYSNGYKILGNLSVAGPDAIEKAQVLADMLFARLEMHGVPVTEENRFVEIFGSNVLYKGVVNQAEQPHEVLLRVGAKGNDRDALNILGKEIAPLLTSGPPGATGFAGGRARATEVIGYWPALIDKGNVSTRVAIMEV